MAEWLNVWASGPTSEQKNEREKNTTDPTRSTRTRATERGSNVTNTRTHARTYGQTKYVCECICILGPVVFLLRLCVVVYVHISENSTFNIRQNASCHRWVTWSKNDGAYYEFLGRVYYQSFARLRWNAWLDQVRPQHLCKLFLQSTASNLYSEEERATMGRKYSPWAKSTTSRRNLKTAFSPWKRIKCFPSTLHRENLKTK